MTNPEQYVTAEFAAGNAYAYANLRPVVAADRDGQFWHIAAGAAVGALIGGGVEAVTQYAQHGKVEDWGRVAAASGGGAVSGAITAAAPGAGLVGSAVSNGVSGAAEGVATRVIASGGKDAGTVTDVLVDAGTSVATAGVMGGGSSAFKKVMPKKAPKPPASKAPVGKVGGRESKPLYRSMSQGEADAVARTGLLRGGNPGETYWTDSRFRSASKAQDRLSLPQKPEVQMEFRLRNSLSLAKDGTRVQPDFGGTGRGREFMSIDPVEVEIINVQPYTQ